MAERVASLTDLPLDILVLIFPYLNASSFLSLCSTCKALHQSSIRLDSSYWSQVTRCTFRVPNQPVVQADGERWQKLYRRLLTQSRVFTWGSNTHRCLGHTLETHNVHMTPQMRRRWTYRDSYVSFPTEMERARELGIIADMQCGGWSTTLLTSKGCLYTVGILDGLNAARDHSTNGLLPLQYPPGFPQAIERYEPSVAIRQFSSGRSHILGLSDSGKIWSWYSAHMPSLQVKFLHVDINEVLLMSGPNQSMIEQGRSAGRVRQVVAGWSKSSAYIHGTGIILWAPVKRIQDEEDMDTMFVMESVVVPKTAYQRQKNYFRDPKEVEALGEEVGSVVNYIVLEHFVVFVTDIGKVFTAKMTWHGDYGSVPEVLELRVLRNDTRTTSDVQGSFRSFAVFKDGEVITAHQDYLEQCWERRHDDLDQNEITGLKRIPALQHNDVISVAFGDYHFHALHSTGRITSYGTEPQGCGALGLGGDGDPEGRIRGIRYVGFSRDGKLLPHAYTHGRQVWFEPEKKQWIRFMTSGGKDPEEAKERLRMTVTDANVQGEVSEWFEQEGKDWDKHPDLKDADEDGLGAYFALSISAAGWHSGALVLVNEGLAAKVRDRCIVADPDVAESSQVEGETGIQEGVSSSEPSSSQPLGAIASTLRWVNSWARWFLGLPSFPDNNYNETHAVKPAPRRLFTEPTMHGASPGKGFQYTWAQNSFPRLRLADGTEMPGQVPFLEWRFERPDWQLNVDV
ncbi:RCC1/BLIP-II protein [Glonium stellatum]|uniref:RCC1/BLIP-II protein n=1 Tax=Glonium stellatum TaxID=574774 RepID=A0A8E2JWY4_9PEZI|nr:RCC1/BLIP-II protein [Glonium stellatum]